MYNVTLISVNLIERQLEVLDQLIRIFSIVSTPKRCAKGIVYDMIDNGAILVALDDRAITSDVRILAAVYYCRVYVPHGCYARIEAVGRAQEQNPFEWRALASDLTAHLRATAITDVRCSIAEPTSELARFDACLNGEWSIATDRRVILP